MPIKTNPGNFFEDFSRGATLTHAVPRTITEGDCALYIGLTGDRYPLHCSAEYARSLGYPRETINDLLVFHMVFGKTVSDVSLNAVANLGYAGLRFLAPVYPGDTLRSISTVLGKKENANGQNGIVWVRTQGRNQHGTDVLEYCRWVMVNKRDTSKKTLDNDRPELPVEVRPEQLVVPSSLDLSRYESWPSGGRSFFDDYEPRERIDHCDGMTIEEAEHAIATRLYQNTAKVHFDGYAAKSTRFGKRLIYGGHVISLARALSFNGLENALGILAINGGTHSNPTFAGDTIYAFSEVLARAALPGRADVGALRVRLCAVKNADPSEASIPIKVEKDGREAYHPSVVLDLDLWLLMP
ncbi:MAG: MaoC family dehydratase, partial [Polyangiales bacterium]